MNKWLKTSIVAAGAAVFSALGIGIPAFASFDYTNTFSGVQTELTTALTAIVPLVIVVFALVLSIRLAFRFFRSFSR